jgi:nucleosome binding factor SPN SPT16 subunit
LLKYEFPDTIIVLTGTKLYLLTSEKKGRHAVTHGAHS